MNKLLRSATVLATSIVLLGSCGKTISFEEAKKVIQDNYVMTEGKEAAVKTVTDIKKASGLLELAGEVGKKEATISAKQYPLTVTAAAIYSTGYTIKLDGTALSFEQKLSAKDYMKEMGTELKDGDNISGESYTIVNYDSNGFITKSYTKTNISFKTSVLGVTVEGALDMTETITYSY